MKQPSKQSKPKPKIAPAYFETFVAMAGHAPGSELFRSFMMRESATGKARDILEDGDYSCAFFVSCLLVLTKFIPEPCATVDSLEKKLAAIDWERHDATNIQLGDIVFWERITFANGSSNRHVGIALSAHEAASTDYTKKSVAKHHITYGTKPDGSPVRRIESVFRCPSPRL